MARGASLLAAAFGLLALAAVASAQDADDHRRHKTETNGLALGAGIGIGSQYGGFVGVQAMYYAQLPDSLFRVAPYVGVGLAGCAGNGNQTLCAGGYAVGAQGSWGHKHRATLSLSYATVHVVAGWPASGGPGDIRTAQGIALAVGYEWMAFSGAILRSEIGLAYGWRSWARNDRGAIYPTATLLGVGYKF